MKKSLNWLKENLFYNYLSGSISVILIFIFSIMLFNIINWVFIDSVWVGDANKCREASGACIAFIKEKFWFILFGVYPKDLLWRPILAILILLSFIYFYASKLKNWKKSILLYFCLVFASYLFLLRGGLGLKVVDTSYWGGLPLTLLLAICGITMAYPVGILLAMGRISNLNVFRYLCIFYIELIRGVPLISLLFMASVMFPLFLPEGITVDKLIRAQAAIIMFSAAYLAEVIRGGLQSISKGQYEAADSLGLNYAQKMGLIILPQALKIVIPPTVNTMIGMFKDTSLVIIIALFDLMGTTKASLTESKWLGFSMEGYFFIAMIYFLFCFGMSRYSRNLEKILNKETV